MKIAVTTDGNTVDAPISASFTKSPFFALIDGKTLEYQFIPNEGKQGTKGSAGMKAVKQLKNEGANLVLTGEMKHNLYSTFQQAGVKVYMNVTGTLADILKELK